jgi:hypothetical protein
LSFSCCPASPVSASQFRLHVNLLRLLQPFTSTALAALLVFGLLSGWATKSSPEVMNAETKQGFNVLVSAYLKRLVYCFYSREPEDVLILGSSVVLNPCCQADIRYELRSPTITWLDYNKRMENYTHARDFERSLGNVFGRQISAVNLALPSAVMEDNAFVLKKLIEMHRSPSLIVLGLTPRDFLVNLTNNQGPTITEQLLNAYRPLPFSTEWLGNGPANFFQSLYVFQQSLTADNMSEQRNLLKMSMKDSAAELWEKIWWRVRVGSWRPTVDATRFYLADGYIDAPVNFADLKYFPNIYSDLTRPFLEKQLVAFEEVLKAAHDANIPVFVASMPMSAPNKILFKGNVADRYQTAVHKLIGEYGATLWIADQDGTWPLKYFHDSVHLNAHGGHLFFAQLAKELASNAAISQHLARSADRLKLSSTAQMR